MTWLDCFAMDSPALGRHSLCDSVLVRNPTPVIGEFYSFVFKSHKNVLSNRLHVASENPTPVENLNQLVLSRKPLNCVSVSTRNAIMKRTDTCQVASSQ